MLEHLELRDETAKTNIVISKLQDSSLIVEVCKDFDWDNHSFKLTATQAQQIINFLTKKLKDE